jgi:hypothetical protein
MNAPRFIQSFTLARLICLIIILLMIAGCTENTGTSSEAIKIADNIQEPAIPGPFVELIVNYAEKIDCINSYHPESDEKALPKPGRVFLLVNLSIKNVDDEEEYHFEENYLTINTEQQSSCITEKVKDLLDNPFISCDIAVGETRHGEAVFGILEGTDAHNMNLLDDTGNIITSADLARFFGATPLHTLTPTPIPTPTQIHTPKPFPTQVTPYSGVIFFDYNGNGIRDVNEPPIQDVTVQIGDHIATSRNDGSYYMKSMPVGVQKVKISAEKFDYISFSPAEFQSIDSSFSVYLKDGDNLNIGLMHGFLTLPISSDTEYTIDRMYDHAQGWTVLWWDGEHVNDPENPDPIFYAVPPGTNEHPGIDYGVPTGTEVLAAAPGFVDWTGVECKILIFKHESFTGLPVFTRYTHFSKILVENGQFVERGEIIGLSGKNCTCYPHIHFQVNSRSTQRHMVILDPYRPIVPVPEGMWIPDDPLPEWTEEYHALDGISLWTIENDPQHPY